MFVADPTLNRNTLKINEIFYSIQGESTWTGVPTVFVRLTGCHLRCHYCDTKYSYHEGQHQTFLEVKDVIKNYPTKYICITGGEPLLQKPIFTFMNELVSEGFYISIETSGSKSIKDINEKVKVILDIKTPDSGAPNSFLIENLDWINSSTEIKFVITSEKDFHWSEDFCKRHRLQDRCQVLYSPSFEDVSVQWLAQKMLDSGSLSRLQIQLHKFIWEPSERGV